jgi:AraC family transcriptional regulator
MFAAAWHPGKKRRVIEHIEANLDKSLTCGTLAELVGLSTSYFNRAFKSSFGRTPHSFLISRRLERAQDLLLATDEPISQIALACGLADQCHLCRLFRKLVGESPGAGSYSSAVAILREEICLTCSDARPGESDTPCYCRGKKSPLSPLPAQ